MCRFTLDEVTQAHRTSGPYALLSVLHEVRVKILNTKSPNKMDYLNRIRPFYENFDIYYPNTLECKVGLVDCYTALSELTHDTLYVTKALKSYESVITIVFDLNTYSYKEQMNWAEDFLARYPDNVYVRKLIARRYLSYNKFLTVALILIFIVSYRFSYPIIQGSRKR